MARSSDLQRVLVSIGNTARCPAAAPKQEFPESIKSLWKADKVRGFFNSPQMKRLSGHGDGDGDGGWCIHPDLSLFTRYSENKVQRTLALASKLYCSVQFKAGDMNNINRRKSLLVQWTNSQSVQSFHSTKLFCLIAIVVCLGLL